MRVIIQRVKSSHVSVDGEVVGKIGQGLNLLVGISDTDTDTELDWMAKKCLELRLFPGVEDGSGAEGGRQRFDRSVQDINGELLVISQFTLYGDCRKGRRPSFDRAATPTITEKQYERFVEKLRQSGLKVETGIFGAIMQVAIDNDGPVTIILERDAAPPNA